MPSVSLFRPTVTRPEKSTAKHKKKKSKSKKTRRKPKNVKNESEQTAVWWMAWTDPKSKKRMRRSTGSKYKDIAKQKARKMERQLLLESLGLADENFTPVQWVDFREEFIAHSRITNRPSTADAYALSLKHFGGLVDGKCVHQIDVALLQDFVALRRTQLRGGRPISPATVNKDLRAIRAAMNFAVDRGYLKACPKFRSVMMREDRPAPVVVPRNDRAAIYDAVRAEDIELRVRPAAWWLVLLTVIDQLGVRRNEALGLKWADINFGTNEATVHAVSSKGRRYRTLPMSERLVAILRDWKDATRNESTDSILPWEKKTLRPFYDDWNRILEKAGLPQGTRVVPKHFRSTCGSELIEAGAPTVVVKDFLGHASVTTTESHYINTGSSLKKASEARERMVSGLPAG